MHFRPALGAALALSMFGCSVQRPAATEQAATRGAAFSGVVHGGQQPVTGALIQLYAAGTGGDGSAATPLIGTTIKTDPNGDFNINSAYQCPANPAQVYLVATGGNPGITPPTASNSQIAMMAALGPCSSLNSNTFINVNELTTVAAVWALAPYMSSYSMVGSGSADAGSMTNAFLLANEYVNAATGTAPGATVPANFVAPTSELNLLADIIASCVNSAGGAAGDGSLCGNLFVAATPSGGSAPSDTAGAALQIAKNPNQNVSAVFGLPSASGPFQPLLPSAPADWTLQILPSSVTRILFIGDSFTYGRYTPVRNYNSANTTDENYGLPSSNARAESTSEPGPYGGIPGIFKMLTTEAGLNYDVHVEAIASTSLATQYSEASPVIANAQWNAVVLQEISTRPIPTSLTGDNTSNPSNFCSSVQTIESAVHAANSAAGVYLYETWARADEAQALGSSTYSANLTSLFNAYHNSYYRAAALDGHIAGVAAVGDAWQLAINDGYATADPYTSSTGPFLWYGINATNNPAISSADEYHPSIYGAYLSALVLYGQITGHDPAAFGSSEAAAASLGISATVAAELQQVAHTQVYSGSSAPINQTVDPCSVN